MFICNCLLEGETRRVVIDCRRISWVSAIDDVRTEIGMHDGTVLTALAPYSELRAELLASRDRTIVVLD
jgi:hypothetical protein